MLQHQGHAGVREQLERGERCARALLGERQQLQGIAGRGHGHQRHHLGSRQRKQLEHGGGDDAQRAFGADIQVAQVVAGVVLAQGAQAVPYLALGCDDFEPQAQLARIAVAQHLHATGIGGQVAADGARTLGGQAQREQAPGIARSVLHLLQRGAGFHHQGVVQRIDMAHAVEPGQGQQQWQWLACCLGDRPARQPRVAALRYHRHAVRMAPGEQLRHLGRVRRLCDGQGRAAPLAAPVGQERCGVRRLGPQPAGIGGAQGGQGACGGGGDHRVLLVSLLARSAPCRAVSAAALRTTINAFLWIVKMV